jgi:hypothetical protein
MLQTKWLKNHLYGRKFPIRLALNLAIFSLEFLVKVDQLRSNLDLNNVFKLRPKLAFLTSPNCDLILDLNIVLIVTKSLILANSAYV